MYINISLRNFCKPRKQFEKYFSFYKQLSKYKNLEFETYYSGYDIFIFELDFCPIAKDHGGLIINLNFLGFEGSLRIYDSRHWDCKNWRWEE